MGNSFTDLIQTQQSSIVNLRLECVSDGRIISRPEKIDIEDKYDFIKANYDKYSIYELLFSNIRKMNF